MQLGIHAYAWCSEWSNKTLDILDTAKKEDLDFLEIPLMKLEDFDSKAVLKRKNEVGIDVVTSNVILAAEQDITSKVPEYRSNGIRYLKQCVDATAAVESDSFSGVLYSQYCKPATLPPTSDDWKWSAESLHEVGIYAKQFGITIGLEPVTRYESNLLNTCEQAINLLDMIGLENVKVHLDTYHMNVEEKDFYQATKLARGRLCHYHFCENDRGIPGSGHVDWEGVFRALKENDYHGRVGMEGFSDITDNMSTWVWRKLAPSGDVFLHEGIKFIRSMIKKYDL
ncbi:sugar phosphate isomerase/epimerase [uncultured Sphaerochaeta sp.]|uniref:sugar phosphate isomerase/epimerase family protein n=1 Tax=uncultured Sphaerochaeta sp. TaxID=886478 RepID=UPI002A0A263D|nr:sugar phosphate isomerase/epimerase [uncultured Sphaerochaeta sp.]